MFGSGSVPADRSFGGGVSALLALAAFTISASAVARGLWVVMFPSEIPSDIACDLRWYPTSPMAAHLIWQAAQIAIWPDATQKTAAALTLRLQARCRNAGSSAMRAPLACKPAMGHRSCLWAKVASVLKEPLRNRGFWASGR